MRIYVCHTYYHSYIAFLKELKIRADTASVSAGIATDGAILVLSRMSNDFEDLASRVRATGVFSEVVEYDEKREDYFDELGPLRQDTGSMVGNLRNRIRFTKRFAQLQEQFVPACLKAANVREAAKRGETDIYVFCDIDPIGTYLSQNRIYYHAVEDGLDCLSAYDTARVSNAGHFGVKRFLSEKLNLIFISEGYNKYCLDMEVNDKSKIKYPHSKQIEVPRKQLTARLTAEDKDDLLHAYVKNLPELKAKISECMGVGAILILTDPLCDLESRERIFRDIIDMYKAEGTIFIKPHPRDVLDYKTIFADYPQFDRTLPMEMLNFFPGLRFKKVVGVFTQMGAIECADECIQLGSDFMDKYEAHDKHNWNEKI